MKGPYFCLKPPCRSLATQAAPDTFSKTPEPGHLQLVSHPSAGKKRIPGALVTPGPWPPLTDSAPSILPFVPSPALTSNGLTFGSECDSLSHVYVLKDPFAESVRVTPEVEVGTRSVTWPACDVCHPIFEV